MLTLRRSPHSSAPIDLITTTANTMFVTSIKRVVSCFILSGQHGATRDSLKIAVFHRCDTMPTFPSHWAPCSGSIEEGETPYQTACRELQEETNLIPNETATVNKQYGLYVDVPFRKTEERETIIRVYPFAVQLHNENDAKLKLLGTEHDYFKFVSVQELEELQPAVPALARAFHHATRGKYLSDNVVSDSVLGWANDKVSGAATMAKNALQLVSTEEVDPALLKMFRPSMVAISNAMTRVENGEAVESALTSLEVETQRAVDYAVNQLETLLREHRTTKNESPMVICTFSRSSTLVAILKRLQEQQRDKNSSESIRIVCSKSTPGDEGVLMAQDLGDVECVNDEEIVQRIRHNQVDVALVGSDCVTETSVVNKIGTAALAEAASTSPRCKVYCCTDRWKQWDDIFPPPLEDIFEQVPKSLFDKILMPPPPGQQETVQQCANKL